eukprot:Gb_11873 [translate_table: standard]
MISPAPSTSPSLRSLQVITTQVKESLENQESLILDKAEEVGSVPPNPLEVTLEYDKATSSLKKVTRRKVKTESQVTMIQKEENFLSLTHKRKREESGTSMEDEEMITDPISIFRSTNKMSEEVDKWGSKLVTLGSVAQKNLLPNLSLLELDEVVTCNNILAKTKKELEDGDAPLMASNKQLDSSTHNIKVLLDNARLPGDETR